MTRVRPGGDGVWCMQELGMGNWPAAVEWKYGHAEVPPCDCLPGLSDRARVVASTCHLRSSIPCSLLQGHPSVVEALRCVTLSMSQTKDATRGEGRDIRPSEVCESVLAKVGEHSVEWM